MTQFPIEEYIRIMGHGSRPTEDILQAIGVGYELIKNDQEKKEKQKQKEKEQEQKYREEGYKLFLQANEKGQPPQETFTSYTSGKPVTRTLGQGEGDVFAENYAAQMIGKPSQFNVNIPPEQAKPQNIDLTTLLKLGIGLKGDYNTTINEPTLPDTRTQAEIETGGNYQPTPQKREANAYDITQYLASISRGEKPSTNINLEQKGIDPAKQAMIDIQNKRLIIAKEEARKKGEYYFNYISNKNKSDKMAIWKEKNDQIAEIDKKLKDYYLLPDEEVEKLTLKREEYQVISDKLYNSFSEVKSAGAQTKPKDKDELGLFK